MTRWMPGHHRNLSVTGLTSALPSNGVTVLPDSPDFEWRHWTDVNLAQTKYRSVALNSCEASESGLLPSQKEEWIPEKYVKLKIRLFTVAYTGAAFRKGSNTTFKAIRERLTWADLRWEVRTFASSGVICTVLKSDIKVAHSKLQFTQLSNTSWYISTISSYKKVKTSWSMF